MRNFYDLCVERQSHSGFSLQTLKSLSGLYNNILLFVLRFYGPVNPTGSCRARSVYLTTRLLGRLKVTKINLCNVPDLWQKFLAKMMIWFLHLFQHCLSHIQLLKGSLCAIKHHTKHHKLNSVSSWIQTGFMERKLLLHYL